MFFADPHPAEDGFVAVHETYSRTIVCSANGFSQESPFRQIKSAVLGYGKDRGPEPNRATSVLPPNLPAPRKPDGSAIPIVAVLSANESGRINMLAGRIADCLANRGLRVAVSRLTGTRRTALAESCNWVVTRDLLDYGYLSTQHLDGRELERLFAVQLSDLAAASPDVIVMELEGTLWRQDVRIMLSIIGATRAASTAVISAVEPGAALLGRQMAEQAGLDVAAFWSPRADAGSLKRDSRIRKSGIRVCSRGAATCAARAITATLRRRWVPLGNGLLNRPTLAAAA
ncbi:MAG: hypothetical protein JJ896_09875 [Rhodothermales bacterium]|nr:hypothetical protein [Rhodothermales bacterium]